MNMTASNYFHVTGTIFGVIGLLHVLRLLFGWEAQIGGFVVPVWFSVLAVLVAGYLTWNAFQLEQKK